MPQRLITAAYVCAILSAGWALNNASQDRSEAKLRSSVNACLRSGNPSRAVDHLDSGGYARRLREKFEPIVDCHRTFFDNEGVPVPLRLPEQRRYVNSIRLGVRPAITDDGRVQP